MATLSLAVAVSQPAAKPAVARGPYLGEKPPGKTPTIFAPGIVSLANFSEIRIAFSPNGDECFFSRSSQYGKYPWNLYYTKRVNNIWTPPVLAPFPQQGDFTGQPFFSADGNSLYFTSKANGSTDIWVVQHTSQGWGSPQVLPSPINSTDSDVYYSHTLDGTAYFASDRPGGKGALDIWRTRKVTGQPLQVENLGATINTSAYDYDPYVDPNGRYLLFASDRSGLTSVFVSYGNGNGGWSVPINMNTVVPGFNTGGADGPSISPDGKYLFWRRYDDGRPYTYWVENPLNELTAAKPMEVTGPYFGQKPPGKILEIFAPGILSRSDRMVTRVAFSPDGNECFFSAPNDTFSDVQMYYTKLVNNVWTPPVPAPFLLPGHSYRQALFSADGNKLYFSSDQNGTSDIWVVERSSQGWGNPLVLPAPINTSSYYEGKYTQTTDGTAYIESDRPGGQGGFDIWRIRPQQPGQPAQVENLGPLVNSSVGDGDPFVSPDGRYLLFESNRPGGHGQGDLYVIFADGSGGWTAPVNLNQYIPGINTEDDEYGQTLSPDGRYLFFVRLFHNGTQQKALYWVENPFFEPAQRGFQSHGPRLRHTGRHGPMHHVVAVYEPTTDPYDRIKWGKSYE
jgi:Tol biopolymer transport system component